MRHVRLVNAPAILRGAFAGNDLASASDYGAKVAAVAMVKRAIARVNNVGFDVAKVECMERNGRFFDHEMDVVVGDMAGKSVVHGGNP